MKQGKTPVARPEEYVTLRYLTEFSCLGADCEDTCCRGWTVPLDKRDYTRLKSALRGRSGREAFRKGIALSRQDGKPSGDQYATLITDGGCAFLRDGLCSIHARHGNRALPNLCATYPRAVSLVGKRIEAVAGLSCPEMARLCLGAADATELVVLDPATLPRQHYVRSVEPASSEDPYTQYFDDVRSTAIGVLALTTYPIASRLFFVAYFADRVHEFFHKGTTTFTESRFGEEIERLRDPEIIDGLHDQFHNITTASDLASAVTQGVLRSRMGAGVTPQFGALVDGVYQSYLGADGVDDCDVDSRAQHVWTEYRLRAARWEDRLGDRIDQYFTNYAINYWMKEWYTRLDSLLDHTRRLVISHALLRFLILSHPDLHAVGDDPTAGESELAELLDEVAVKVVYQFARNVEHSEGFLEEVDRTLDSHGIRSFGHMALLLKP